MSTDVQVNVTDDFLTDLQDQFAKSPDPLPRGGLPGGQYFARLKGINPGTSKRTGNKYISIDLEVVGPDDSEHLGAPIAIVQTFKDADSFTRFKTTLQRFGITTRDFQEALAELGKLAGSVWDVTAKHSEDGLYCNFYVNRQVSK